MAVSTDGQTIVSAGGDGTVRLWNRDGQPIGQPLQGHAGAVNSVAISADDRIIISGGADGKMRIWQGITWQGLLKIACNRIRLHPTFTSSSNKKNTKQQKEVLQEAVRLCLKRRILTPTQQAQILVAQALAIAKYQGKIREATKHIEQAYELDNSTVNLEQLEQKTKYLAANYFIKAGEYQAGFGQVEKALTNFQKAYELDSRINLEQLKQKAKDLAANYFIRRGADQARNGQVKKALTNFQKAYELDSTVNLEQLEQEAKDLAVKYFIKAGKTLARNGQVKKALTNFQKAYELDSTVNLEQLEQEAKDLAVKHRLSR